MENNINIQWFPGHMTKTFRTIEAQLKLIDVIAEITDARLPESGRNHLLAKAAGNKPRLLLLNKRDYADPNATKLWLQHYKSQGQVALACDCRSGAGLEKLPALLEKAAGQRKYGGAIRVMAAGIPNSGKSSFINRMAGSRKTAVGDKPGVTRGKQWIRIGGTGGAGGKGGKSTPLEILDLPGVLEPKIEDKQAALHLAYTGAVRDAVMDTLALARNLGAFLLLNHTDKFAARYGLSECGGDILEAIAQARSMRIAGGQLDLERAAAALLDDFRSAKIGKITLELPPVRV